MKVIDLLNKIAKGEKVPQNIKFLQNIYEYEKDRKEYTTKTSSCGWHTLLYDILDRHNILELIECEVEILEDKTEEIEEIQNFTCLTKGNNGEIIKLLNELSICYGEKLNELARAINQIKKDFLAIGVDYGNDCDKETNCMTD